MQKKWGMSYNVNMIPEDFNWKIYLELNPDIKRNARFNTQLGAENHWLKFGKMEGRLYNTKDKYGLIKFPDFNKDEPISNGFYSNYFYVLSMIIDAENMDLKPYVMLNNTAFVGNYNPYLDSLPLYTENTWDWWFDQKNPSNTEVAVEIHHSTKNIYHSEKMWGNKKLNELREINNKYIKIKQHILDEIDEYYNKNLKDNIVLGVMARGSEMNKIHPEYGNHTIDSWVNTTKDILIEHPEINLIFLVTEDSNYIPIYVNKFPNTKYMENVFRRTTESDEYINKYPLWPCIVNPRENHTKRLGEECLIQAKLLGMCNYLLIKQCGTSSAAILFANDNLKEVYYC